MYRDDHKFTCLNISVSTISDSVFVKACATVSNAHRPSDYICRVLKVLVHSVK